MVSSKAVCVAAVIVLGKCNLQLVAQVACPVEWMVNAQDIALSQTFGYSVAIDGNTAIVAAVGDADGGNFAGSAYVLVFDGVSWSEEAELIAMDSQINDYFGSGGVSKSGNTAIVGVPKRDEIGEDSGVAYIFMRSDGTWSQQAKLVPSDAVAGQKFGYSVAVDGDTAVVSAFSPGWPPSASSQWTYVYERNGTAWVEQSKLIVAEGGQHNKVAVCGDTIVAGASALNTLAVYVRDGTDWDVQAQLVAADGSVLGSSSVSISGDSVVAGSPNTDRNGAAFVFVRDGPIWYQEATLKGSDSGGHSFGASVDISQDTVVIGDPGITAITPEGSASVFTRRDGAWTQQARLAPESTLASSKYMEYGTSVAVSGSTVVVGAPLWFPDGGPQYDQGSAYFYRASGGFEKIIQDMNGDSHVDGGDLAILLSDWGVGDLADIDGDGITNGADLAELLARWGPVCQ